MKRPTIAVTYDEVCPSCRSNAREARLVVFREGRWWPCPDSWHPR